MSTHAYACINHPLAKLALVAKSPAKRLVVFVHGWRGAATRTWGDFVEPPDDEFWMLSDLLFMEYDSVNEAVPAVSDRLRRYLSDFYPTPRILADASIEFPNRANAPYEELLLVGHSLGGLVLRRAIVDAMDEWRFLQFRPECRPDILDARVRLFSPASAGFSPSGVLGALNAAPMWWVVEMFLKSGPAFRDLQPGSAIIRETRARTERYGSSPERALAASLLWANPEQVVLPERYDNDARSRTVDGTTHKSVCKPSVEYKTPFEFVEDRLSW